MIYALISTHIMTESAFCRLLFFISAQKKFGRYQASFVASLDNYEVLNNNILRAQWVIKTLTIYTLV